MLGLQKTLGLNDVDAAVTTLVGGGIATGAAIDKLRQAINGDRIATEDMTIKDKYGKEMKIAKGDTFNIQDIDPENRIKALEHSKIEPSFAGKIAGKTWDGMKKVGDTLVGGKPSSQTANYTSNETTDTSHNDNNTHTNQTSPDNPHSSSPSSFSTSKNDEEKKVNTFADKNLVNKAPKGITTLGKFAIENLIDGTPLNPTSLADDYLYQGKFKGFAPDDDWLTPKEALVRVGNNAFETNVNFDALNNWMQANPKRAQMLQSALNHQTYISPVDLENISTPDGLFNYVMSHTKMTEISPTAATALHQPTTGADYHTSVANQIQAIQLQQRLVQDQEYMRQFINPVNPAYGVTLQTASGELSLASTPRGTLEIGGHQTNVPVSEFRNFMNSNPDSYQNFVQTVANSNINNNNASDLFSGYQKLDNGRVENILQVMQYQTSRQADNTMIGLMEKRRKQIFLFVSKYLSLFNHIVYFFNFF